jgi:hypothetical protein
MHIDIIAAVSLIIATTAVLLTLRQNVLQGRATEAQIFLHTLDQSVVVSPENWTGPYVKEAESTKGLEKKAETYGNRATPAQ